MTDIITNIDNCHQYGAGYLILLDQSKAFDKGNHEYLFTTLEYLGINEDFLEITKLIYNNITSQIMINGKLTTEITMERGLRQGFSLSILLFGFSSIPLIELIKDNQHQASNRVRTRKIDVHEAF